MAFFKFRWPGQSEPAAPADKPAAKRSRAAPQAESIEAMRRRARHRLIGAAVLVALGVVGFPLLFDTQPRPIAVDIPIEIPDRNKTAPVVVPAPAPAPAAAQAPSAAPASAAVARQSAPAPQPAVGRTAPGQGSAGNGLSEGEEIIAGPNKPALVPKPPVVAAVPKPEPAPKPEHKPEPRPVAAATPAPAPAAPARSSGTDEAARARALLEGRTTAPAVAASAAPASAEDARFIVQVGAFADADKAREARTKVERAGLKTFVQVVDTKDGKRTRVRVGPYNNRADADKAAGKIRSLELSASVLTL